MLYLFNSAARVGYVENVLNTLYLPKGVENVYQYSWNSGPYIHANISKGTLTSKNFSDLEVLIVFINKEKDPYEYLPLRKARFLKKDDVDGRAYFTVTMGEYCFPKEGIAKFSATFADTFKDKVFKSNSEESSKIDTKEEKRNNGYLSFTGCALSSNLDVGNECWYKVVSILKEIPVFKDANSIFTKLTIKKKDEGLGATNISNPGQPVFTFVKGKQYNAELAYYIPFHDINVGSYLEVEMISNPDNSILYGSALLQRLNVLQGVANYRFYASNTTKIGEIIFRSKKIFGVGDKEIKMAWRGVNYTVKHGVKRVSMIFFAIIVAAIALLCVNYFSTYINSATSFSDVSGWYYFGVAICSLISSGALWWATIVFGNKG